MTSLVAAGHPATVDAAAELLDRGGNAFDAIVAAGAAASICEPALTSAGGGGFVLAHPVDGNPVLFDFFVDTPGLGRDVAPDASDLTPITVRFPSADQEFWVGAASIAVPGALPGWLHVHERLGRLPLPDVFAPAVRLADQGVEVNGFQSTLFALLEPIFTFSAATAATFAPDGAVLTQGDRCANPPLAGFYADVAAGRLLHEPDFIASICDGLRAEGSALTPEDMAGYRVIERAPLRIRYRDAVVLTNPGPSLGGRLVAHALDHLGRLAPAERHGDRTHVLGLADALARIAPGSDYPQAVHGTTHVSVTDDAGNVASMTTSNGTGSGVVLPGTGVHANNIMGEADLHPNGWFTSPPGTRVGSMMAPSILERPGRAPVAFGTGGSERIRSALTQFVVDLVDFDMPIADAVAAPRAHVEHGVLQLEPGFTAAVLDEVRERYPVNVWGVRDLYFGGLHAVSPSGEHCGDLRRGGSSTSVG